MALAYDTSSQGSYAGSSPFSWTHTPVGTPKGVFVGICEDGTTTDDIVSVTYGGVAMTRIPPRESSNGSLGQTYAYFLGSGIPTGAQTVSVTCPGPSGNITAFAITVTAGAGKNTQLAGTGSGTSTANPPTVTISSIASASYGFGVWLSNQSALGGTAGSGQTLRQSIDFGSHTGYSESSSSENASGNLTIAFANSSSVNSMVGIAIEEVTAAVTFGKVFLKSQAVNRASTY